MEFYQLHQVNEWTCVKIVEYYRAKIKKKDWGTVLDSVKKDLQKVAEVNSGFDATRRRKAQEIVDRWKHWTAPTDRNMDNPHFKVEFQKIKTTKSSSASASPVSDGENEEQDEPIEIDLMSIKKQLEMVPLIEWKVGDINVTQKFRQYQRSVIDKAMNYGLKWDDSYEILAFASIIVLSWPCPYSKFFTNREWDQITQTNPYVIQYPVIPSQTSTVLREVAMKHLMGKESYMQPDESELSKAVARTFNDLCDVPIYSPVKMSEELHCDKLLFPYINSLFFRRLAEYEVRLNCAVGSSKKRPDFSCVVDDVPILNSEIKPLGVTPLKRKKDFAKIHLRAKKSINQQLNLKGGPGEAGLLMNMGDVVESFFMDFRFGLYCSWPFHRTRLAIDKASMPLIESNFCHFVALEARIERVNKLAEDFKGRSQQFTPPLQIKFMTEFPDSPQLRQLLELS
ncbi:9675_t:CDS:2 [Dentiscutata erythropus]|uniref:9675_t:CDS:1 n=1 Tax=Dentiscutata erythropus TaxID=1348616 RepID=A0A9N9J7F4_9GLOM|nr:9675_t:CDS:2 [Dentiscutata erythropus]